MPPTHIRRQRLLTFCAIVIVFMLYRVVQNSWDESTSYEGLRTFDKPPAAGHQPPPSDYKAPAVDVVVDRPKKIDSSAKKPASWDDESDQSDLDDDDDNRKLVQPPPRPKPKPGKDSSTKDGSWDDVQWKNPPNDGSNKAILGGSSVHWKKVPENFPLPKESIIPLPTGKPKSIPKIQYEFAAESETARKTREQRQKRVKTEIERSWASYKKRAWMHDELLPVSGGSRDPFCRWGATLVDSLDTLWITGLKDEFHDAVQAVRKIDFTWTPRHDIPVFETTIRYLGGLLSAFDLSGGHKGDYKVLLDKAVELGEILIGIFDTPNRMPLLYYAWQPDFASQPKRTGNVGIAELATLSMEFTRLAQLTGEDKYYDAIDRITNGLVEMQEDGTAIPGLFPEGIDASGCNKTASTSKDDISKEAQQQLDSPTTPKGYPGEEKRSANDDASAVSESALHSERSDSGRVAPLAADGHTASWECKPQGLVPSGRGYQTFHMGGGQDSAYEYFPKEFLLLGGLEPKYQKLYEDSVDAINEWLLFRPMSDDDWDVMFPAHISVNNRVDGDLQPQFEITHLTCFIGAMYGLGGKAFGREKDVEMGKKLTDGCVWAYQLMPSGLMPELSHVLPCPTLDKCEFNETMWWDKLDRAHEWRDQEMARLGKEARGGDAVEKPEVSPNPSSSSTPTPTPSPAAYNSDKAGEADKLKQAAQEYATDSKAKPDTESLHKRASIPIVDEKAADEAESQIPESLKKKLGIDETEEETKSSSESSESTKDTDGSGSKPPSSSEKKYPAGDSESNGVPSGFGSPSRVSKNKAMPVSHEEYVKDKIKQEKLPPGFTDINRSNYLLRPEAIESVWYMYRITGDQSWADKGWTMFEATIRASRTEYANSAVNDVTLEVPRLLDEMESFWIAETLKYYYLLFSEPDVINLDEWVLNTEAHPFKRPT